MSQPAQPDMGDRPAPHAPGAEVMPALVLPGPARPPSAHAHPAFVEGLAPSYTLAFARHLLDGRVALKRARAVLQSWWHVNRGRGWDCTSGHLTTFSKMLGWDAEFQPPPVPPGSALPSSSPARWTTPSRPLHGAHRLAMATAIAAANGGESMAAPMPSPVGFKRAHDDPSSSSSWGGEQPPPTVGAGPPPEEEEVWPKRLRTEVSDSTTAPALSPPPPPPLPSYDIGAEGAAVLPQPVGGGDAEAEAAVAAEGSKGAAPAVATPGPEAALTLHAVASPALDAQPAGQGEGQAAGGGNGGGDEGGGAAEGAEGGGQITYEPRLSSPSFSSAATAVVDPATAAAAAAGGMAAKATRALLPSVPPPLSRQHERWLLPFPQPHPPRASEQPRQEQGQQQQQQQQQQQEAAAVNPPPPLEGVGPLPPPQPPTGQQPPVHASAPEEGGPITSPIPILPPLSAPTFSGQAFASCGVAWMYSEEEEQQRFPPYLEVSCCPTFAAHFLAEEELRALMELQNLPIELAWGSLVAPEETPAGYLEAHAAALASAAAGAQPRPPAPAEAAAAAVTLDGLGAFYLALSSATFCVPGGGGGVGEMGGQQHADVMAFGKACTRLRMLVRDSPPVPLAAVTGAAAAVGGEQRRPCPFDVKIVHYVTDDGRYSAWTLELEVVLTTPSHDLRGLHHYGFCGARPPPPPLLELPPEVVAAVVGAEEGEEGMSLRAGSA